MYTLSSCWHCVCGHAKGEKKNFKRKYRGAVPQESSWIPKAQSVDWSRGSLEEFQKTEEAFSKSCTGRLAETIQVDRDSQGLGECNYYSEPWNTQLMKAKLTLSVQDFLFKHKKTSFVNASKEKSTSQINNTSFLHVYKIATINRWKSKEPVRGFFLTLFSSNLDFLL